MFKLSRHKSSGYEDRLEFKFFNLRLLQVPKGWDRLFVSIISAESGKAIGRSGKALVHSGTCQWADSFSESVLLPQDGALKESDDFKFKFVISTGSVRSGILGETISNLADHMNSECSGVISLPLKRCDHGSILQLQVQCLIRRAKPRDAKSWVERALHREGSNASADHEIDNKSDGSDQTLGGAGNHLGGISNSDDNGNTEPSLSVSGSQFSSDSSESYPSRTNFSPGSSTNGGPHHPVGRQDSTGSHSSAVSSVGNGDDLPRSNQSSFNSRLSGSSNTNQWQELSSQTPQPCSTMALATTTNSTKELLAAAEETIEELRDEAKMWERHARKLKLDLDVLKKECSEKSKQKSKLDSELLDACSERDSYKRELEQCKLSLHGSSARKDVTDEHTKIEKMSSIQHELEGELKFLKESNANLRMQLDKTQESNVELVSVLQELEETTERQRGEIEILLQQPREGLASGTILDFQETGELDGVVEILRTRVRNLEEKSIYLERKCEFYENSEKDCNCDKSLNGNCSDTVQGMKVKPIFCDNYSQEELDGINSEIADLKGTCLSKDMEIESLKHSIRELENLISKNPRVEGMVAFESACRRCSTGPRFDDEVQNEKTHASSGKVFEMKLMELESTNYELDLQISELENEKILLAEHIFSLEAQLKELVNEKVLNGLEIENSSLSIASLRDEISELQDHKSELTLKLQEMQQLLVDAEGGAEILKSSNVRLHERNRHLEVKLEESQRKSLEFGKQFEIWEEKLSSLQSDVMTKEKSLTATIESIFKEHKVHKEKISESYFKLNQIEVGKAAEVEKLKGEIACLNDEACEPSELLLEKVRLETDLREAVSKLKLCEAELSSFKLEFGSEVQVLADSLNASKQTEELLMSDISRLERQLKAVKSSEETFRRSSSELELKLKAYDYEKQHVSEEVSTLKLLLQKIPLLEGDLAALKISLDNEKFEKGKLEELLNSESEALRELKSENASMLDKICNMQGELHEVEDNWHLRIALEDEVMRLVCDLTSVEALRAVEQDLQNELGLVKRTNSANQRNIQCPERDKADLERDKADLMARDLSMEEETVLRKEGNQNMLSQDVENNLPKDMGRPKEDSEVDPVSTVSSLEAELPDVLLVKCGSRLISSIVEKSDSHDNSNKARDPPPSLENGTAVAANMNAGQDRRITSLEAELKDMKERYLAMSLQFAQVEAQREELVMTLKSMKKQTKGL